MLSYTLVTLLALGALPEVQCLLNPRTPLYPNTTSAHYGCPSPVSLSVSAKRFPVVVGAGGDLRFSPNELDADLGDIIEFMFLALNHTLTQSSLLNPCGSNGEFSTGFEQFNPKNESGKFVIEHKVTTKKPQWFFCAQIKPKSHCQAGMVFAVNPGDKMEAFLLAATTRGALKGISTLAIDPPAATTTTEPVAPTFSPSSTTFTQTPPAQNTSSVAPAGVSFALLSASVSRWATLAASLGLLVSLFCLL